MELLVDVIMGFDSIEPFVVVTMEDGERSGDEEMKILAGK